MNEDFITTSIDINVKGIEGKIETLIDDRFMLQVHQLFAKMCEPYVPMDEGVLAQTTHITPQFVQYATEYAHYMYTGDVYGPNYYVPITRKIGPDGKWHWDPDGEWGWRSPRGKGAKHKTGKAITYSTEKHSLATKEWDKAMMTAEGDKFIKQVKDLLVRRAKELYG